jgi:carbamoyl-phosphate synthase large subunit
MAVSIIRSAISSLPSVGILQLFKKEGINVIGADLHQKSAGAVMLKEFFTVPKSNEKNASKVTEIFLKQVKKHKVKAILSGPENEIMVLAKYEQEFAKHNSIIFHPSFLNLKKITNKYELYKLVSTHINCGVFFSGEDFKSRKLPKGEWIVKPKSGRGSSGVFKVNKDNSMLNKGIFNPENIVQLFAEGEEYTVDFLCDMDGNLLNCVPRKRVLVESGIAVVSSTVKDLELIESIKRLCQLIEFRGFNCAQFIKNKNTYILTDVNPRIGGGSILSIHACESMKNNLVSLIKEKPVRQKLSPASYKKVNMYRYYSEVYK